MELSALYSDEIIEIAGHLPVIERLKDPDGWARRVSRVCGSVITVDLKLAGGVVSDYGHELKACALGQAAAAIMARNVIGSSPNQLRRVRDQMHAMLKDNGPPPAGRWADLAYLEPVRAYKPRHISTLLVFDAVADALDAIEKRSHP